jgi:hypothetical protein
VTTRTPLFDEAGRGEETTNSEKAKVKYFSQQGWTGVIALKALAK